MTHPDAYSAQQTGNDRCPDCGVAPGEYHKDGCDMGGWPTFPEPLLWPDEADPGRQAEGSPE